MSNGDNSRYPTTNEDAKEKTLYKRPSLSMSSPNFGSTVVPEAPLTRVNSTRSIFSIFRASDSKSKSVNEKRQSSLSKRSSFFSIKIPNFGINSKPEPNPRKSKEYIKPLDFQNQNSNSGSIRGWDSLTDEELTSAVLETPRTRSVVARPEFTYNISERRHSDVIPARRSSLLVKNMTSVNYDELASDSKAMQILGSEFSLNGSKLGRKKVHSVYQPQNIIGDMSTTFNPPIIPKQDETLPKLDISKTLDNVDDQVSVSSAFSSKSKGIALQKLSITSIQDSKSADGSDSSNSSSPLTISPVSQFFGSPPKYFAFNRPIESKSELLSMKKQIMDLDIPTEIALPQLSDATMFPLEMGESGIEDSGRNLPAGYLSLGRKKSVIRSTFENSHTTITESGVSDSLSSLDSEDAEAKNLGSTSVETSTVDIPLIHEEPTLAVHLENNADFDFDRASTDSEDSISDNDDDSDRIKRTSENILMKLQELKLESTKSGFQMLLPERKSSKTKASIGKRLSEIDYKLKPDFGQQKVKSKQWRWLEKLFNSSRTPEHDSFYPAPNKEEGRLTDDMERSIYAQSHIKLAEVDRPLREQVQISNLMLYILKFNAQVTLHGRGPQRKKKKGKRKRSKLLMETSPTIIMEDIRPARKIPAEPLIKFEKPKKDDDDDIPLAILQQRTE